MKIITKCKKIKLKTIVDSRGSLVQIQKNSIIPLNIKRIFYIYGVPKNKNRGFHAHKKQSQLIICMSGILRVKIKINTITKYFQLSNKNEGLYIPPKIWVDEIKFNKNTVAMVIVDDVFKEDDYLRNYDEYLKFTKKRKN